MHRAGKRLSLAKIFQDSAKAVKSNEHSSFSIPYSTPTHQTSTLYAFPQLRALYAMTSPISPRRWSFHNLHQKARRRSPSRQESREQEQRAGPKIVLVPIPHSRLSSECSMSVHLKCPWNILDPVTARQDRLCVTGF